MEGISGGTGAGKTDFCDSAGYGTDPGYGNILIQQIALGKIKSIEEGFELISKSAKVYNYKPKNKF